MRELIWVNSSKKDYLKLPDKTIDKFGYGLYLAQIGGKHDKAKPLQGFGSGDIIEIIDQNDSGTYRVVYTIKMAKAVFVLHAFQKKSKQGIKTPKEDIDLIKSRIKRAQEIYNERFAK